MVELSLTDEQLEFKKLAGEFAQKEIAPRAEHFDSQALMPAEILSKAWQTGLINVQLPEAVGGLSLGILETVVIQEELSRGSSGIAGIAEASAISLLPLIHLGSEEQKRRFLAPFAGEPLFGAYDSALFQIGERESEGGFTYRAEGEGFSVSGRGKIVNGQIGAFAVFRAIKESEGEKSLFILPLDAGEVRMGRTVESIGRKCLKTVEIELIGMRLERESLIGEEGKADEIILSTAAQANLIVAAGCTGVAQAALDHSIKYSKERHTFGKPIGEHQAVAFMLADMAKDIEAARLLVYRASSLIESGVDAYDDAAIARLFAQEMVMRAATDAVQVFGGYGYSKEYPVERLMRDAKSCQLTLTTSQALSCLVGRRCLFESQT